MISTRNLQALPDIAQLKQICKAIAVLDAIISPEWEYRYYSYTSIWDEGEECATMRDGSGDEYLILFNQYGVVMNGLAHEVEPWEVDKQIIPGEFHEFMFGEPVSSLGTTFCVWRKHTDQQWQAAHNKLEEDDEYGDGSADLLFILDGHPQTYKDWAEEYYEGEIEGEVPLPVVTQIYQGKPLNKEMVVALNPHFQDWKALEEELDEIAYPYNF
jgi:hypothetical protein